MEKKAAAIEARERERIEIRTATKKLKDTLSHSLTAVSSLFQMWDYDGNGTLTLSEFEQAVNALNISGGVHPKAITAVFNEFDASGDGKVSHTEFLRFAFRDALARSATRVMDFFRSMDIDDSGTIGLEEFRAATRSLGFDVPHYELDAIFAEMDTDKSGSISFAELNTQLRQGASIQLSKRLQVGGAGRIRMKTSERFLNEDGVPALPLSTESQMLTESNSGSNLRRPMPAEFAAALGTPAQRPITAPALMAKTPSPFMPPPPASPTLYLDARRQLKFVNPLSLLTVMERDPSTSSLMQPYPGVGLARSSSQCRVVPGGGGGPRSPHNRPRGFGSGGLVVCDEKRRRTIQDEKVREVQSRSMVMGRPPTVSFATTTVAGYRGHRLSEPLPSITHGAVPMWTVSAMRTQANPRTAGTRSFSASRLAPLEAETALALDPLLSGGA